MALVPAIRTAGTPSFGTASTLAPAVPTHAIGDLLICVAASSANASVTPTHAISGGSGTWNTKGSAEIASGTVRAKVTLYWRIATSASESAPTITFTPTGTTAAHHCAVVHSYQNPSLDADPFEGFNTNSAAATNAIALTLTTTRVNGKAIAAAHHADNVATGVTTASQSYTQRTATDDGTGIDGFTYVGDFAAGNGSGQGTTVTYTSGGTGVGIAGLVACIKEVLYTGGLSSTIAVPSGSIGGNTVAGGLSSTIAVPSGSVEASHGVAGSFSSTIAVPTGSAEAAHGVAAAFDSTIPVPSGSVGAAHGVAGTFSSTIPVPSGSIEAQHDGDTTVTGDFASTIAVPSGSVEAAHGVAGSASSTIPVPSGSVDGAHGVAASAASTIPVPSGSVEAAHGVAASMSSTIAAPTSAMSGNSAVGALTSTIPVPTGAIGVSHGFTFEATLASTIPPPSSTLLVMFEGPYAASGATKTTDQTQATGTRTGGSQSTRTEP